MHEPFKKFTQEVKTALIEAIRSQEVKDLIAKTKEAEDSGVFEVVISTSDLDRQGETIDQTGWDLAHYRENPVVLWGHDYYSLPIGITESIEVADGKLVARGRFAPQEANPFAQQVRKLYDLKIVRATSVGFIARETEGNTIIKAELLEFSFVPVPANPFALSLEKAKELGLDLDMLKAKGLAPKEKAEEGDTCTMPDGSEGEMRPDENGEMVCMPKKAGPATKPQPEDEGDYFIIRVKDPGYFDPDSFRTISISDEQGIKATVGCKKGEYEDGACKIGTEVQRYLFDKEKWSLEEAQAWVDEHEKTQESKLTKKDVEQIGAELTALQSEIDDAIVNRAKRIIEIAQAQPEKPEKEEGQGEGTSTSTTAAVLPDNSGKEGSAGKDQPAPQAAQNQRSTVPGSEGAIKDIDEFLMARSILRTFTTHATQALERMNKNMRKRRLHTSQ